MVRLLGLFTRRTADSRMDEDIQAHIDLLTQQHLRQGMPLDEARLAARRSFGGLVRTKEQYRDQYGFRLVDELAQDFRYTVRALRRSAGFAWTAILILALGIGATTAIFSVVYSVLIRPLVYPDSDRLVRIVHEIGGSDQTYFSDEIFVAYLENARAFQDLGVWVPAGRANVSGQGEPEEVRALAASRGVLTTLGVQPALGRWFSEKDDARNDIDPRLLAPEVRWRSSHRRARPQHRRASS